MSLTSNSLFHDIAKVAKPQSTGFPKRIISYDDITTIDKIIIVVEYTEHPIGSVITGSEVLVISHDDYREYCEGEGKTMIDVGPWDDSTLVDVGYAEYMKDMNTRIDFKEYIIAKNLLNGYTWSC